jgi:MSHA biogenesis protein MshQ
MKAVLRLLLLSLLALPGLCRALPTAYATWHMNEGLWNGSSGEVKDSSGNGFNGTASIANGSTPTPTTASGSPAYTSGSQSTCNYGLFGTTTGTIRSYGYVALPTTMTAFTTSFTVTAWIRPTNNTTAGQRIFQRDQDGNGWGLSLGDPGTGALRFYNRNILSTGAVTGSGSNSACAAGGVLCLDTSTSLISTNTWYFVGVVVNTSAKTINMYVYSQAGTLLSSPGTAYSGTWTDGTGTPTIGGGAAGSSEGVQAQYHFQGNLDEVQVFASALTQANVVSELPLVQNCLPDHYQVSLPSTSINCVTSTVSVTACADSSSPCTNAYVNANGATANLATSGGSLGASSITFDATGAASTTLSDSSAANGTAVAVTLSGESVSANNARQCCPNGTSCSVANSCSTTFNTAGFITASTAGGPSVTIPTQTAGTTSASYYLRAVQTNTSTGACTALLTGAQSVQWTYLCGNPSSCSAGNLATINGSSSTAIPGSTSSNSTSGPVPMTFDSNGNAPFSFVYNDVGQITLYSGLGINGIVLLGISNTFVVKPAGFTVSNIKQTASPNLANPGATSASGSKFVKAGESFSATITAKTSTGATAPNFGQETTPQGVLLTPTLVLPSGGVTGTLSNGTVSGSFSSGVATATNLAYSEVGIITLTPSVSGGSYLGAGAVTGTSTGNIGRFVPAQFALSSASVVNRASLSCSPASTYTHLGENFGLVFTLTAQNVSGSTTQNYTGSFAYLNPATASAWNLSGVGGSTTFSTTSGRLALGSASGAFSNGVASGVTLVASASRASTPDGPFSALFGIAPVDSDGVAMASYNMAGTYGGSTDHTQVATVTLRFGRLMVSSGMGAASHTLTLPVTAQYWNGSAFDTDTLDSCTTVPTSAMNFGNLRGTLASTDTAATSAVSISSGLGNLVLAAPASGHSGTFDLALSLGSSTTDTSCLQTWAPSTAATAGANLSYLRGGWCGSTWGYDPNARASFGLQGTQTNLLYRRENY